MSRTAVDDYIALITSQYQTSSKFIAWMTEALTKFSDAVICAASLDTVFDIDNAQGAQLDTLGVLIGVARYIAIPLPEGLFFSWDDGSSPSLPGWGEGSWRDPSESSAEMTVLPDDAYRQVLKFKIIQNQWKGTADELYRAWEVVFAADGLTLQITDNQDMTVDIIITGDAIPATVQYILQGNYLPMKPAGVEVSYTFNES